MAANHKVTITKKDPAVSDLNDPLKAAGVYDVPTWRKIQHLADIRNLCDHKKGREPTESEVAELIAGVSTIVKTIFLGGLTQAPNRELQGAIVALRML